MAKLSSPATVEIRVKTKKMRRCPEDEKINSQELLRKHNNIIKNIMLSFLPDELQREYNAQRPT